MAADFDHFGSFSQHWQPRYELFFDMNGAFSDTPALQRRFRVQLWPARPPSQVPAPSLLLSLICKRTGSFGTRCSIFAVFSAWEDVARWRSPGLFRHTPKGRKGLGGLAVACQLRNKCLKSRRCFSGRKLVQVLAGHWRSVCRVSRFNCFLNFFNLFASGLCSRSRTPAGLT